MDNPNTQMPGGNNMRSARTPKFEIVATEKERQERGCFVYFVKFPGKKPTFGEAFLEITNTKDKGVGIERNIPTKLFNELIPDSVFWKSIRFAKFEDGREEYRLKVTGSRAKTILQRLPLHNHDASESRLLSDDELQQARKFVLYFFHESLNERLESSFIRRAIPKKVFHGAVLAEITRLIISVIPLCESQEAVQKHN